MAGCNVSYMPSEIGRLIALTHCNLKGNNLCTLPDSICNLTCLQKLSLSGCNVSHLPNEIERLSLLTDLDLEGNILCTLPDSICNLTYLEYLSISSCNVSHLPSEIGRLISLKYLNLDGNNLCTLPESFCNLTRLGRLDMANCNVSHLPSEIWRLQSLETWHLGGNNLCSLPDGISNLTQLLYLYLDKSARLQSLPKLPLSLSNLYAEDCALLENIELKGAVRTNMFLYGCHKLAGNNFANEFVKRAARIDDVHAMKSCIAEGAKVNIRMVVLLCIELHLKAELRVLRSWSVVELRLILLMMVDTRRFIVQWRVGICRLQ
ncbi:Plant intracellular Ras-group-related LRR protein 4 [Camellia lanceoleosa]|uniref:Plant intracellular Ras-group-related LRR protein 4 n=1 Tax=Camellia lanceoleosa TaxID=1840588 RepID=A0ACC0F5T6_9ERIC|nr:Plant intracellular Ras-group-related LRR protein 4 [Camellia lanceoleosa]